VTTASSLPRSLSRSAHSQNKNENEGPPALQHETTSRKTQRRVLARRSSTSRLYFSSRAAAGKTKSGPAALIWPPRSVHTYIHNPFLDQPSLVLRPDSNNPRPLSFYHLLALQHYKKFVFGRHYLLMVAAPAMSFY
jgi:hypothetical protein